ncbi:MAG TPA: O-antigen ligase family protein [Vicinamibacterales bacterium]|nr:O-antigen ligase family protein [Vicinamibacterales bacterium]
MTTTTMTAIARPAFGLDRAALWLLLAFVAALQLSIAVAGILLTASLAAWAALLIRDRARPTAPAFMVPLAVYAAATLVSAAFSLDPAASIVDSKQLVLLLIVPMVYYVARGSSANLVVDVILAVGAISAAYGIVQYGVLHYDSLRMRPDGALTHYMTYSGTLMLVLCAAVARLVFATRERTWPALVMPALVLALAVSLGRNAWVGACVAVALLLALRDFRLVALLPVAIAILLVAAPDSVTNRVMSMFDLRDPTNQDRVAMLEAGADIVRDHPLTGVGPAMVPRVYEQYRPDYAVQKLNPHLHNVLMQIAAERGLPALAIWVWLMVTLSMLLVRLFRSGRERLLTATAMAATAAMLAAGLFEYNFGDSEFLMLYLVLITLPFAALNSERGSDKARATITARA